MLELFKRIPPWLRLNFLLPLFFLNGWLISQFLATLQPLGSLFFGAALLAFLLDIPVRLLVQRKLNRLVAIALVLLGALILIGIGLLIIVPLVVNQLGDLLENLPQWIKSGNAQLATVQAWLNQHSNNLELEIQPLITQALEKLTSVLNSLSNQLLGLVGVTISTLISGLIFLVLTIFFLLGGEQLWDGLFDWFPNPWRHTLPTLIRETFERYFAIQALLAGILSVAQIIVFSLLQAPYAILFAITIGLTTLIPYASAISIVIISLLLMLQNFWLGVKILLAAVIVGQINDNVLAPRLMGNLTGLNPIWVIVSLFIGGKFAGVLGLLIAVPAAGVIKSLGDRFKPAPAGELAPVNPNESVILPPRPQPPERSDVNVVFVLLNIEW